MSRQQALFADREEAGRLLAEQLAPYRGTGALVLGVPRGGVVVAAEVARRLGLELDVVVSRKLGAPGLQELAIGAVTADGERYLNAEVARALGVSEIYIESATAIERTEAARREAAFRAGRPPIAILGRVVIVVDDGLATGATVRAACQSLRARKPEKLLVAVPVASREACRELRPVADQLVCPFELDDLVAIGRHYERFEPVEDVEVQRLLESSQRAIAASPT